MAYDICKEIQTDISKIISEGCYVYKTNDNIAVFTLCNEQKMEANEKELDAALLPYRNKYKVYIMTDEFSRKFNGR